MDSFTLMDSNFDFLKHHNFTDEEIAQTLQKGLENPTSPFTMTESANFDFCTLLGEDSPKQTSNNVPGLKIEDVPLPSIENAEGIADASAIARNSAADIQCSSDTSDPTTMATTGPNNDLDLEGTGAGTTALDGLKDDSVDPLLYHLDNFDDLFGGNGQAMTGLEDTNALPTLASPFQVSQQRIDVMSDLLMHDQAMIPRQGSINDRRHIAAPEFPIGRRRSQTVPPEFESGASFQRRIGNGMHMPYNHSMRPPVLRQGYPQNAIRGRRLDGGLPPSSFPMGMPRSYPITPPARHPDITRAQQEFIQPPPHPKSLNPEIRMSLMNRTREISPDRARRAKRQKQNHDRVLQAPVVPRHPQLIMPGMDMGEYGIDQAMAGVEFLLRDTREKIRYERNGEVEKVRCEARAVNATITSLATTLAAMASKDPPPMEVPKTGQDVKDLNTQSIHALLDFFDVPFVSTMFLHDKKLLYLNFLGANGTLKHLVLD